MISKPPAQRLVLVLIAGCLAAFVAVLASAFVGTSGARGVARIDFNDVAIDDDTDVSGSHYTVPPLRVAIAAMISPESTMEYYGDLLELIGERTGRRTVFLQRKTYAEVNRLLERKEVDIAFVCSGPYVTGHAAFGMEILAVPEVGGKSVYHSYILAHRDSDVLSFDDLEGRRFAFTDPNSNTGSLVPRYMLARQGETPDTAFSETFFTYSHDNSIKAVAEGLADGASVDSLVWEFIDATDPTFTARTRIVEKSPPYGIPPVVVHPGLDAEFKQRLRDLFMTLHNDEEAAFLMRQLHIDRFVGGDDGTYDSVREMQRWIARQTRPAG
jgi:phosphonate transport system substrate-binding protein